MGSRLQGKVALITGGAGGIGACTAQLFIDEGAALILVDADEQQLERASSALKQSHPEAKVERFTADVSDQRLAIGAIEHAKRSLGRLDILINNAAMRIYSALSDVTPAQWQAIVSVNLIGASNFCQAALPLLRQSGAGSIVNVSSCYAVTGRKGMGLYDATKAGMLAMTRTLAFEEAEHGVRVNAICPGSTLTDFHINRAKAAGQDLETLKTQRQETSLLKRWAAPLEIARPILWLASDEASYITGAALMVDGGLSIM